MKFTNRKIETLLVLALGLILFSFFAPSIFTKHSSFAETGQIGDTIGGLMNPFIAIAGVIVTGLAFYMQYLANKIQVENFEKTQKDQLEQADKDLFIRLIDNLNLKVQNYSLASVSSSPLIGRSLIESNNLGVRTDIKGYGAIDHIHKSILEEKKMRLTQLGCKLLARYPEQIDIHHFSSIVLLENGDLLSLEKRSENLKNKLMKFQSYLERYEYMNSLYEGDNKRKEDLDGRLNILAISNFEKFDFNLRNSSFYQLISMNIIEKYGSFINSYTKNLEFIIDLVLKKEKSESFYRQYLLSNISYHEKFILFYYCGSIKVPMDFKQKLLKLDFFEGSFIKSKDMLIGDEDLMKQEIVNVLTKTQSIV